MSLTAPGCMDVERRGGWTGKYRFRRRTQGIFYLSCMVGVLPLRVVDVTEFPQHTQKVGLSLQQESERQRADPTQGGKA